MENYNLLSLTQLQKNNDRKIVYQPNEIGTDTINIANAVTKNIDYKINNTDSATLNGKVVDVFGTLSDDVIENVFNKAIPELNPIKSPTTKFATTYKSYSPADIAKIKGIIYTINHPGSGGSGSGTADPDISDEPTPGASTVPGSSDEPTPGTSTDPGISDNPTVSDEPGTEPSEEIYGEGEGTGQSFITNKYNNFYNAETMFEYLSTVSGGQITKESGITRTQLIKLTQNELAEADNICFFGALNRIFDNTTHFNKDGNEVLSFDEIDKLFQTLGYANELGEDPTAFLNKVNQYSDEIQAQYESLSSQKKLEFIIAKAKEYLQATGLTKQLEALNRLSGETDTANPRATAKVGQIVVTDLNTDIDRNAPGAVITLGAYSGITTQPVLGVGDGLWKVKSSEHPKKNNMPYEIGLWYTDDDNYLGEDLGLTIDISVIQDEPWYSAVDTMVHELTHATAYIYADETNKYLKDEYGNIRYDEATGEPIDNPSILQLFKYNEIKNLHDKGLISNSDWNYYEANLNTDLNVLYRNNQISKINEYMQIAANLMYATSCMWGEYAAYQTGSDYMDSVAGDVFDSAGNRYGNRGIDYAVASSSEQQAIVEHVFSLYDDNGQGSYNTVTEQYELQAYPEGNLEDAIFTFNSRKNWTWA